MYSLFSASKASNLGFFLGEGADQARSRKVLLRPGGDIGEHGLNALEAFVDAPAEVLHHDADHRQRQEGPERQLGAEVDHEEQRADGENDGVGRIHDRRAEQHAHGVQVIGGAGHDVAGAGSLVVAVGKRFQMAKQIVAQIELDIARDADHDPAGKELENAFADRYGHQHEGVGGKLIAGDSRVQIVDGPADHQGKENPDAVVEQNRERSRDQSAPVFLQVWEQRTQMVQHARRSLSN